MWLTSCSDLSSIIKIITLEILQGFLLFIFYRTHYLVKETEKEYNGRERRYICES